ncbi:MAG: CDP-diacylglycerol--glycerol-3-phosphate 3-phosphatidyltransferase [Ignavibacteriales bacterium]|nr:CDP-diacylglycerol--glycerol-3-phosphate 3-phosphatidyltransferase [Ignavibacteriales bacterium]
MLTFSPPNQLTFLRIILTPVFIAFLLSSNLTLRQVSLVIFLIAMLTDWYDGWVARRWGYITRWGSFLDPLADKIFASAALFAFAVLNLFPAWAVWVVVVRDFGITFLRTYSEVKGRPFTTKKLAKTKTFLQFLVIFYVLVLYVARSTEAFKEYLPLIEKLLDPPLLYSLMVVVATTTVWTGVVYVVENWRTIRELYVSPSRVTEPR